ncbi:hypothetical protein [Longimicrobium sp.]|uniref:hypothetical protein n=1 Tax=Longimicrobium sp. TaxID=2029185 RepID=UPI003B3A67FD
MNGAAADGEDIFPGSRGSAHLVEWIDRVLIDLRDGRINDARAALESQEWRTLNLAGIPDPIRNQMHESLEAAAQALREDQPSPGEAEAALLIARSRFIPGG